MPDIPEPIAVEARAKIFWGESPAQVLAYLQSKAVGAQDAGALLEELLAERAESIRSDGKKQLWLGALAVATPIVYFGLTRHYLGLWSIRAFAPLVILGGGGIVKFTQGLSMVFRPGAVTGDLSKSED